MMKKSLVVGRGVLLAWAIAMSACNDPREPYLRIHEAALTRDSHSLIILIEQGSAVLSGNAFSATWSYQAAELALWRLDRRSGELSRIRRIAPAADFRAFYGAATLQQFATNEALDSTTLPDCVAALTQCAIHRAPEPYTARDLRDDRDRGLKVIDPTAGVVVRGIGNTLTLEPWNLRTSEAIHAAATAAKRESVRRIFEAALRVINEAMSKTGALPTARTATMIDSAIAAGNEGFLPEYFVEAGGIIGAQLTYANDPPTKLRWTPSVAKKLDGMPVTFACESDRPEAANWYTGCKFSPRPETLDPELIYIGERLPQLKASAIKDDVYQRARRGVTFGVRYSNREDTEVWLSCLGVPATRVGDCDVDHGDTVCDVSLPLLCMYPDATVQPKFSSEEMRSRWLAANVAASPPVRGDSLETVAAANAHCAAEFGTGWRVVRWRDHGDGFIARGKITAERRLWIDAPETSAANCWRR